MDKICISVIIPVYNVAPYLNRCIESILAQTMKEIEVILIDDGSIDGSSDICDRWAIIDSRISVLHKKNEGQSKARNIGIEMANGDFIAFVDSDDYISQETYETLYDECIRNKLDIAYYCYDRFDSKGRTWRNSDLKETEFYFGNRQIMSYYLNLVGRIPCEYNKYHYTTSASMALYRASIIKRSNLRFVDVREIASEDLLFNLELIPLTERIGVYPYYFYHYFVNDHSTTTTYSDEKYKRLIKCLYAIKAHCEKYFLPKEFSPHFYSQLLRIFKVILRYESINKNSFYEKIKRIKMVCQHPLLHDMYQDSIIKGFSVDNRFYIWCMKHSMVYFFVILYAFKKNS